MKFIQPLILLIFTATLSGQEAKQAPVHLTFALFALAQNHDGLVGFHVEGKPIPNLQLSTRYFSKPVKISPDSNNTIYLTSATVAANATITDKTTSQPNQEDSIALHPRPLAKLSLPNKNSTHYHIILIPNPDAPKGKPSSSKLPYKAIAIPSQKIPRGGMIVFNVTPQIIAIRLKENKTIKLNPGKFHLFKGTNPPSSQAIAIFQPSKDERSNQWEKIFSSHWRVHPHRREFCIISPNNHNKGLKLRTILDNAQPRSPN